VHKLGTGVILYFTKKILAESDWLRQCGEVLSHAVSWRLNYYVAPCYLPDQTWHCHRALGLVI